MDRLPNLFAVVVLAALAWLTPAAVTAQAGAEADQASLEEARRIFGEGLAHSDRREWHEAVASFRQVLELRTAPPVLYNLAIALFETGDYPEAQERLEAVLASEDADATLRASATELLGKLEARAAKLEVRFDGDAAGTLVLVDAYPVGPAAQERPVFVTPGPHELTARRGSTVLSRAQIDAQRGETTAVALAAPPSPEVVAEEATPAARPPLVRDDEDRLARNPWFWTGVGGAVLVGVTLAVVLSVRSRDVAAPHQGDFTPGMITW